MWHRKEFKCSSLSIPKRGAIIVTINYKVWLEQGGKPLLGAGRYRLLKNIGRTGSLKQSAAAVGISYKTAQNYIGRIEKRLGRKIVVTQKGGDAGGSTHLTDEGRNLIAKYSEAEARFR